jgi:hypothetical protein
MPSERSSLNELRPIATDPHAPRLARATGVAVAVALAAALVGYLVADAGRAAATPTSAALAEAAAIVEAELATGDAITFLPAWSATERWRFERAFAARGLDFVSALVPGDPPDRWDYVGARRVWIVRGPDLARAGSGAELGEVVARHNFGDGLALELIELAPAPPHFDLLAHLAEARVERVAADGAIERCVWRGDRHVCAGAWWTDVFAGLAEVGSTRRRCVFAQPFPDGGTLRVRWDRVPAASRLQGRFGNRLWAVRYDKGSDVAFRLRVGGEVRHEQILDRADFRWHRFDVPLRADEAGLPVMVELSAADAAWRQTCFDLRVVRADGVDGDGSTAVDGRDAAPVAAPAAATAADRVGEPAP